MPEGKHKALNASIGSLLEDYSMVSFLPLDITVRGAAKAFWMPVRTSTTLTCALRLVL